MNIEEMLSTIRDHTDGHVCIRSTNGYAKADFVFVELDEDDEPANVSPGYSEFMGVWHIKEIIQGLETLEGHPVTIERFIQYLENDA